jgi:hypothetical protein
MHRGLPVVLSHVLVPGALLLGLSACKDKPTERAAKATNAKDFWPEAPKPTKTTGTRTFAYKPENIEGYTMTAGGGTPAGAKVPLKFDMTLDLAFKAADAPNERNAFIKKLSLDMNAAGQGMKMLLDGDVMKIDAEGEQTTLKRGEPGPFDVGAMTDKAFTTVVFEPTGAVKVRTITDHPFNQLGGDMLDEALVLLPDLPQGAVAPGHKWSVTHDTTIGGTGTRTKVTYDFVYVGDGACPGGGPACSLFTFSATSPGVDMTTDQGMKVHASYGFAGKVYFDNDRGIVDESRSRADMDVKVQGMDMEIGAIYLIKPVR